MMMLERTPSGWLISEGDTSLALGSARAREIAARILGLPTFPSFEPMLLSDGRVDWEHPDNVTALKTFVRERLTNFEIALIFGVTLRQAQYALTRAGLVRGRGGRKQSRQAISTRPDRLPRRTEDR